MIIVLRIMTLAATTALVVAASHAQWQFMLDTTFRTVIIGNNVSDLRVFDDDGVFLSGNIKFPGELSDRGSALLHPDGTRDLSFTAFTGQGKIVNWEDKMYVGVGQTLRRLNSTGYIDPSYIQMNFGRYFASLQGGDFHVYPDGRILVSGAHILRDSIRGFEGIYNLMWFSNTGYLDTTSVHRKGNGVLYRFRELYDGKFIQSGTCSIYDNESVDWIFRTHADGTVDTTFHSGVFHGDARDYLPLDDGRVYVGGWFRTTQSPDDTIRIARFMENGELDTSFQPPLFTPGFLPDPSGYNTDVKSITPWVNGCLVVTGRFQYVNGQPRRGICMLDSTGALLDAFDDCGVGIFLQSGQYVYSVIGNFIPAGDGEHYYICGAYEDYDDGSVNDTLQRFVTRLILENIPLVVEGPEQRVFQLYPNPVNTIATIVVDQIPINATLLLRDALGRELLHQKVTQNRSTLQVQHLPNGMYTLEIRSANGRPQKQHLVVQH